jgi:phosphatidylglycerophosphatase C
MITRPEKRLKGPQVQPKKRLILFDFDGTITDRDTLAEIMVHYHGAFRYRLGLVALSPFLLMYVLKLMPNHKAKQRFISWFFKGEDIKRFNRQCTEFANHVIPKLVRPGAMEMINHYKSTGATVAVVTASAENWVKPWCDKNGLICLATKLEVRKNRLTGRFQGKNCHGPEKVCRIKEHFDIAQFDEVIAYGDTSGDKEMLALAHQQHYKPFRKGSEKSILKAGKS